jgi:hypothetical protein
MLINVFLCVGMLLTFGLIFVAVVDGLSRKKQVDLDREMFLQISRDQEREILTSIARRSV